jgi:C-terminal processing protease CtpA/Prc
MGTGPFDFLYSGTFAAQGLNIGYIRIPDFQFDFSGDLETELAYMQANTDGLIVDVMRNPGGDGCVAEDTAAHLIPNQFRTVGLEIRATRSWVLAFQQALQDAQAVGAPDTVVQQLQNLVQQLEAAYSTPSGRTGPMPVCYSSLDVPSATDARGRSIAYTKPVMILTDEFTASASELFSAIMQDNQRALIFGARTMGAGGNVNDYPATTYSSATTSVTESLMSRKNSLPADGFPTSPYVENVGVRPDSVQEYMTMDNLMNHGSTFVQAFSDAMVSYINSQK